MTCPGSTETGCRCPDHHPGLSTYAKDPTAYEAMLKPLRGPVVLRVVTPGPLDEPACASTMTCACKHCVQERAQRTAAPTVRQPWQARPARERRAA